MIGRKHAVQLLAMQFHGRFLVQLPRTTEPATAVQPVAIQTSENRSSNLCWCGRRPTLVTAAARAATAGAAAAAALVVEVTVARTHV